MTKSPAAAEAITSEQWGEMNTKKKKKEHWG